MKQFLSTTTQSSSTSAALSRQQSVILLVMTCFALASAAPTTTPLPPSLASSTTFGAVTSTARLQLEPITSAKPANIENRATEDNGSTLPVPTSASSVNLDTTMATTINVESDNEATSTTRLFASTTIESLIGAEKSVTEVDSSTTMKSQEAHESNENFRSTSSPVTLTHGNDKSIDADTIATTIELPIKLNAVERDAPKKGKSKESKKKALKAQWGIDKKQKMKLKPQVEVNHPASATTTAAEVYETTTETAAVSTSIKTAPTTIKSTTLATTRDAERTKPYEATEAAATVSEVASEAPTTANEFENRTEGGDNVIVLNSNSSGLIIVDIMENFGTKNASNTETFEIKMDLIDDVTTTAQDEIFLTTEASTLSAASTTVLSAKIDATDDIILINESVDSTTPASTRIKWNQVKNDDSSGNIKITFDNIDLPNQNVNVSIENGELVIDSIDISVLNKAEEELKKHATKHSSGDERKSNKSDSLEIILIEDDNESELTTSATMRDDEKQSTTLQVELPKHDRMKQIELNDEEDGIKIKTTDKDSDTIFYISNTEVKVIESIPTSAPNVSHERRYYPAIYEQDVIVDMPNRNRMPSNNNNADKYEEDIVLSPLTSDFDPKDINYIGEAFLDVEESQSNGENRHIIPLTSDVVIQPVQLRDMPSVGIPIIGELPPQIELEEMVFSDEQSPVGFRVEEFYPSYHSSQLAKNAFEADAPNVRDVFDARNGTFFPNRTHISINTMINGTNMTASPTSSFPNATAFSLIESEENENADLNDIQTLLLACFATLMPLFLCVIIALTIRYCWRKYRSEGSSGNDMTSDKSTDPLAEKNIASSADELKAAEAGMTLDRGGNMQASTELLLAANGDITPTNHTGTNGSIITMTLKNNHLIVETEERNDISRDTRETKMHYSPSEKDGVFIVEAARGADQNGSHKPSPMQKKPTEAPLVVPEEIKIDTLQSHFTPSSPEEEHKQPKPEQVEVHTPPKEQAKKEPEPVICNGAKTGLSQSDLSLTSSNSSNQNYTYGDKDAYQFEEKGYKGSSPKRLINVHCHDLKPLIENSPPAALVEENNKPVITSAILKNDTPENGEVKVKTNGHVETTKLPPKINGIIPNSKKTNGLDEIIAMPDDNIQLTKLDCNGDHNMDSLSFLPAPPEELSNDQILELTSMDSLPPPPPEMTEIAQS